MTFGTKYLVVLKDTSLDKEIIVNFLSEFLKQNITISNEYLIAPLNDFDNLDIINAMESLMFDLNQNIKCLITPILKENELYDYLDNIYKYFNKDLKENIYDEPKLISEFIDSFDYSNLKSLVLKEYLFDYDMQNTVKTFILNDMNVLKTSKILYMHRNTLLNRLDRFKEATGYDPKKFKDAYILYKVLK